MRHGAILLGLLLVTSCEASAYPKTNSLAMPQQAGPPAARPARGSAGGLPDGQGRAGAPAPQRRVSLSPRLIPGEAFEYEMVFETSTSTARTGVATDPQGPAAEVLTWNAAIRLEVLPAQTSAQPNAQAGAQTGAQAGLPVPQAGMRLRITYGKSAATVRSDTFDPNAAATEEQYHQLEGKVLEFALDASGKVTSVSGLEAFVDGEKAVESARSMIEQLGAGPGAPASGVTLGEKWTSDEAAASLPFAGMVWRTQSQYVREDVCPRTNPAGEPATSGAAKPNPAAGANAEPDEKCAVILTTMNLTQPKTVRDPTSEEFRKNQVRTAGTWTGSNQSESYVSMRTGLIVSMTQTGTQQMNVTLTNEHNDSLRYSGTIRSSTRIALVAPESPSQ